MTFLVRSKTYRIKMNAVTTISWKMFVDKNNFYGLNFTEPWEGGESAAEAIKREIETKENQKRFLKVYTKPRTWAPFYHPMFVVFTSVTVPKL